MLKQLIVSYGARVRGSVFRVIFLFSTEFESVKTSSGFAWFIEMHTAYCVPTRDFFREIETFTTKLSHLTNFFQHHKSMLKR